MRLAASTSTSPPARSTARITFARASTATYYNSSGLIASAASGAPRFDYDPVTLAPRGLLLEEQRTNEVGPLRTSYIPTTSAAVTRAADTAEMTGANFSSWWNASAGTFVAEYRPQSVSGTQPVISVNDTTANEAIRLYGSGTDPKAIIVDGGATQADLDAGTIAAANAAFYKLGLAFAVNDFAACFEGGTVATDTAGTLPTVTQLQFHTDIAGNIANLHIKRLQFFNTRKSDSELQALTAPTIVSITGTGALVAQSAVVASTSGISGSLITDTTLAAARRWSRAQPASQAR
jgi:hypothetical protein